MKIKFLILLLFPLLGFSQLSTKVDSLFHILNTKGAFANMDYDSIYYKLDSIATDDEIIYIADKCDNIIKHNMNIILVDRKSKHLSDLFTQYIFNNAEVYVDRGFMGNISSLASGLYKHIFYQKIKIDEIEMYSKHYSLEEMKRNFMPYETKWTKPEVDSLLTILNKIALSNDNVKPVTLREIFAINKFKFDNYERVRFFAYKDPSIETLITLASFQNKADLPLFHQDIEKSFLAISKFPDASFIPVLKARVHITLYSHEYLNAVAAFKTNEASELLNMVMAEFESARNEKKELEITDGELLNHFYTCLEKNGSDFTNDFLLKMWTEHRIISYSYFLKIKKSHYKEILKGYQNKLPFSSASLNEDFEWARNKKEYEDADGYLCPIILNYLKSNPESKKIDLDAIECKG